MTTPTTGASASSNIPGSPERTEPLGADAGMATAEYAIATLAACGFAAVLLAVLSSGEVRGLLLGLVQRALSLV
ncbi:Protein of unknown function [Quadrisphaera granulorum]|uniref:Uncharacterized protein DUF4244 n=1 Tax=Quadrisphaera granulorum TaxID=317664 RepID=A0A316A8N4_9ACTN|nr:DUF4244 domain-containing protein [Quadrisphaera granulorum]PWJ53340.1 uncharacterized protein DUF4244 [Quadrisphaera granulorum]SZE97014.1 Protein of unknown function [Quadrisphaera granulorum]